MSSELLLKGIFFGIMSLMLAWVVFSRYDAEIGSEKRKNTEQEEDSRGQRYTPGISGSLLPLCLLTLIILAIIYYGTTMAAHLTLSVCFPIFLHISLYYMVLMPVLPFLRRHISARACAMLWMLPNYLYLIYNRFMQVENPLLVLRIPEQVVWILFGVWSAGFAAVLLWKIMSHLIFRARVLQGAVEIDDWSILKIWRNELEELRITKPKFKLVMSPNATSPFSIGLFRRTTKVVLPKRSYSPEELSLIFRHEMIHICREDAWAKFFLVFCTAMCWFNPLMWIAMRKSADDLELSCDETVLLGADDATRQKYANLILDTASDERGFTTCLSASASAMRYRLKNIVKPRTRHSGALIMGLTFFVLFMSCGYVALAYGGGTGAEIIYQSRDIELYTLRNITKSDDAYNIIYKCVDDEALHEYLANLSLENLTGNYSFSNQEEEYYFLYTTPEGTLVITLYDQIIKLVPLYGEDPKASYYYVPTGIDWDYLDTIILDYPALNIHLSKPGDTYGKNVTASLWSLTQSQNGQTTVLYEQEDPLATPSGIFGHYNATQATLDFSQALASNFTVKVEARDADGSSPANSTSNSADCYTITQAELEEPYTFPLTEPSALYTIYATFIDEDGTVYDAEFRFELGEIAD